MDKRAQNWDLEKARERGFETRPNYTSGTRCRRAWRNESEARSGAAGVETGIEIPLKQKENNI